MPRTIFELMPGAGGVPSAICTAIPGEALALVVLNMCNQAAGSDTVRVAIILGGESLALKNYILYDKVITGNDALAYDMTGLRLNTGDSLVVRSANGTTSFIVGAHPSARLRV